MTAIYKRELASYFRTMTGYVFMAFLFVVVGIYFIAYNLNYAYPLFGYSLSASVFVMIIATPVLSMRVLAEERKQKVDQLLLTAPVKLWQIVMGKYLAMVTVFTIPTAVFCLYPVILSSYGEVYRGQTYVSILGFYLMGCTCLAIGLLISSVTENQVIAAVLSFGTLFLCYLMSGIETLIPETSSASFLAITFVVTVLCLYIWKMVENVLMPGLVCVLAEVVNLVIFLLKPELYEGLIQKFLSIFDIFSRFSNLTGGLLDLTGVVYFLSMIAACMFLAIQSIQKRRWS